MEKENDFLDLSFSNENKFSELLETNSNRVENSKIKEENFVSVFDQIFNRLNYFSSIDFNDDEEKGKKFIKEDIDKSSQLNSEYLMKCSSGEFELISVEHQLEDVISSLTEKNIILIMKKLYTLSENEIIFNNKVNQLILLKKLILELKKRLIAKLGNINN